MRAIHGKTAIAKPEELRKEIYRQLAILKKLNADHELGLEETLASTSRRVTASSDTEELRRENVRIKSLLESARYLIGNIESTRMSRMAPLVEESTVPGLIRPH